MGVGMNIKDDGFIATRTGSKLEAAYTYITTWSLRLDSLLGSPHVDKKYCLEMTYRYGLNFWISS
jgi:hypothetical protein